MQARDNAATRFATCAGCLALALWTGAARAGGKQDDRKAKVAAAGKPATEEVPVKGRAGFRQWCIDSFNDAQTQKDRQQERVS